ncbi:hypothetical protein [Marinitoga sp. 1155]|uniref:hypothetical protein n=1 Tax=Marinitoga sp. 1155 TaxID=1428448 RepID=UPI000640F736|nr:hypothetical protein [Marinitoga sp. 1155]KLO23514.1 hypothetical protein X274_06400 [Marinitoga sp. 1155]
MISFEKYSIKIDNSLKKLDSSKLDDFLEMNREKVKKKLNIKSFDKENLEEYFLFNIHQKKEKLEYILNLFDNNKKHYITEFDKVVDDLREIIDICNKDISNYEHTYNGIVKEDKKIEYNIKTRREYYLKIIKEFNNLFVEYESNIKEFNNIKEKILIFMGRKSYFDSFNEFEKLYVIYNKLKNIKYINKINNSILLNSTVEILNSYNKLIYKEIEYYYKKLEEDIKIIFNREIREKMNKININLKDEIKIKEKILEKIFDQNIESIDLIEEIISNLEEIIDLYNSQMSIIYNYFNEYEKYSEYIKMGDLNDVENEIKVIKDRLLSVKKNVFNRFKNIVLSKIKYMERKMIELPEEYLNKLNNRSLKTGFYNYISFYNENISKKRTFEVDLEKIVDKIITFEKKYNNINSRYLKTITKEIRVIPLSNDIEYKFLKYYKILLERYIDYILDDLYLKINDLFNDKYRNFSKKSLNIKLKKIFESYKNEWKDAIKKYNNDLENDYILENEKSLFNKEKKQKILDYIRGNLKKIYDSEKNEISSKYYKKFNLKFDEFNKRRHNLELNGYLSFRKEFLELKEKEDKEVKEYNVLLSEVNEILKYITDSFYLKLTKLDETMIVYGEKYINQFNSIFRSWVNLKIEEEFNKTEKKIEEYSNNMLDKIKRIIKNKEEIFLTEIEEIKRNFFGLIEQEKIKFYQFSNKYKSHISTKDVYDKKINFDEQKIKKDINEIILFKINNNFNINEIKSNLKLLQKSKSKMSREEFYKMEVYYKKLKNKVKNSMDILNDIEENYKKRKIKNKLHKVEKIIGKFEKYINKYENPKKFNLIELVKNRRKK